MTFQQLLTALLLAVYSPLLVFCILAVVVWQDGTGFWWDAPILQWVHAHALGPEWEPSIRFLTKLGVFWGVFPVSVAVGLGLLYKQRWRSLLFLGASLLGSAAINRTAKMLIHRERPHLWDAAFPEIDYAFPSGHAMSSLTLAAALVVLAWGSRWWWAVLVAGSSFVVAIAWTRLYLGVHYPSDILAGWMLSFAWTMGMNFLIHPYSKITVPDSSGIVNT